jgi:hypothetical protein
LDASRDRLRRLTRNNHPASTLISVGVTKRTRTKYPLPWMRVMRVVTAGTGLLAVGGGGGALTFGVIWGAGGATEGAIAELMTGSVAARIISPAPQTTAIQTRSVATRLSPALDLMPTGHSAFTARAP